jgi:hypothetical protein
LRDTPAGAATLANLENADFWLPLGAGKDRGPRPGPQEIENGWREAVLTCDDRLEIRQITGGCAGARLSAEGDNGSDRHRAEPDLHVQMNVLPLATCARSSRFSRHWLDHLIKCFRVNSEIDLSMHQVKILILRNQTQFERRLKKKML